MNTKQKLTLGIAAIFMVTLTIVGVTYAYFVTRVQGATTETVNVQTAVLGEVKYVDGNGTIKLGGEEGNVLPGLPPVTKTFSVTNEANGENASAGSYTLALNVDVTGTWIRSTSDSKTERLAACYNLADTALTNPDSRCLTGTKYDNIYVTIYASTDGETKGSAVVTKQRLKAGENVLFDEYPSDVGASSITINAGETHHYILEVEYVDSQSNQNLENSAIMEIFPTIVK